VAIGSREAAGARREAEPGYRHLLGRGFNGLVRALVLDGIQDTQCGFKLFRGPAARDIFGRLRRYGPDAPVISGPMVTAFDVGCLKCELDYWVKSEAILGFDPATTLFVDDDETALVSADAHGIRHLVHRSKSSSALPPQASAKYRSIETFHALMK
ncbi:MAG: hypothetical protein AABY67_06355, partial [Nitrospirota bacterium]